MLLTKCTLISVIEYCYYTVIGRVGSACCHVSRAATFTRIQVRLHFTREFTKELGFKRTPTVTSYPVQNPNTYHPKVWGEEKLTEVLPGNPLRRTVS